MSYKKIFVVIVVFFLVFSLAPQKSNAQYVDVVQAPKETFWDWIAYNVAQLALKRLTSQTVNWINSGFQGNPAYVTDPDQFFLDIADNTAVRYLSETALNQLCSPFRVQVRLALVKNYIQDPNNYSCTLTTLRNNYDAFMQDFSQGGWDGWFEMTQTSGGNPYSAYFAAESGLLQNIGSATTKQEKELSQGQGFLSYKRCKEGTEFTQAQVVASAAQGAAVQLGGCYEKDKEIVTPGSVINDSLNDALGSTWRRLEAVDEINEIVSALVSQLIGRVIGGIGDGLRGASETTVGGSSYTTSLANDPQEPPVDMGSLVLSPSTYTCVTDPNTGEETCSITPGTVTGPTWIPPISVQTAPLSPSGQCNTGTGNYAGPLRDAMNAVLSADPDLASALNTDANGFIFLARVAQNPPAGYNITDQVLNGNSNPNRGDLLAIWRNGDTLMERYDVITNSGAGDRTLAEALTDQFTGSIPLNCTSSGGGRSCTGCVSGSTTPPPTGTTPPPTGTGTGSAQITSINPTTASAGVTTITISGSNLTNQVSFYDSTGARNTVLGTVNAARTQTTVLVPYGQPSGNTTVRIYQGNQIWSNGVSIQVSSTGGGGASNINFAPILSNWSPVNSNHVGYLGRTYVDGWYAQLSSDGRYVTYGNMQARIANLLTGEERNITPAGESRCWGGYWIQPTTITFVCDSAPGQFNRYEASLSNNWTPVITSDNPALVLGGTFRAADGHWASYQAGVFRMIKDNQVLVGGNGNPNDTGGLGGLDGSLLLSACTNDNLRLCVWDGNQLTYNFPSVVGGFGDHIIGGGNYIAYGNRSSVRGIRISDGQDIDLSAAPLGYNEAASDIVMVNNQPWLVSSAWNDTTLYILLRPWGQRNSIVINTMLFGTRGRLASSVIYNNGIFTAALTGDTGELNVITFSATAPRNSLR